MVTDAHAAQVSAAKIQSSMELFADGMDIIASELLETVFLDAPTRKFR